MGNVVFFSAGGDLWLSDGAAAGTDAVGGPENAGVVDTYGAGLDPTDITAFRGGVLFDGLNSQFRSGLWFSDGTAGGTYEIGGANNSGVGGGPSGGLEPNNITVFGAKALFFDINPDYSSVSNGLNGLWVTDGTASGTFELGGSKNSGISGQYFAGLNPVDLTPAGNKVIFIGRDTDDYTGLWVTDGTTSGTMEIGGLKNAGISGAPSGEFDPIDAMESFGNDVIFPYGGTSLWVSNGTVGGTVDIDSNLYEIGDLTVFGTKVLFAAESGLWITDGTAAGTTEIGGSDNVGIIGTGPGGLDPSDITVFGDKALFLGEDSTGDGGLWVTDGTAGETTEIGEPEDPSNFASIGTKVLFTAIDASGVSTLWVTNGTATGTFEIGGVNNHGVTGAPAAGLDPLSITVSGGIAYFSSPDSTGTKRLWESDGTLAGTHVVAAGSTGVVTGPGDLTAATVNASSLVGANDILLQNANGQAALWDVDGGTLSTSALLGADPGPNWKDVGTADFNGDTHPDLLLQNTNGNVAVWETDGTNVTTTGLVANPGPNWKAVGTSDFNGDGKSDILLQNTNGNVAIWEMDGTSLATSAVVANPGPNWKVVGTGDFNDDGHPDILLQNTSGAVAIWEMNGTNLATSAVVANPGPNWHAIGTGDFNDDGKSDILLQNANGQVAIWEMNGTTMTPDSGIVSSNPGANWHAIGTNGGADILFQNASGQAAIWDMSGTTIAGSGLLSADPGPNWHGVEMKA